MSPTAEAKRLVDQPDERVSVLANGLTVLLKAHRTAPVVSVRMYCKTGSIYEQEYLGCGISHLFEHLLHGSATTTRSEAEARQVLDDIGGNTNAYTSYDRTAYYINTDVEHLDTAVHLLGDWLTRPTWPQEAFDREWGVVQRELERDTDNPDRQLYYLLMETMYHVHPARFPIIGHKSAVQTLTKEDIIGYYKRMYVPDNIVVCVVGDIDLDTALASVQKEFAEFTRKPVPNIVLPEEPAMTTPRFATKRMPVQAAILQLAWPTIPLTHPDLYALDVLSYILTEGNSSRLVRTIRDEGYTYTVKSYSWTPHWARGPFVIEARLAPEKLDQAKAAILEQIERIQKDPVTDEELSQAKRQKAAEHVFGSQTAESVAEMMARDYLSTGDPDFSGAYVANIQNVTAEQIRDVAQRYFQPHRLATITVLPEDFASEAAGEETAHKPEPVRKITLDNGLRCLIRQDPTTPLVAIQSFSLGGVLFESEQTNGLSQLAALLAPRGTESRSAQDIARFFEARGSHISGSSGNNSLYFTTEVLKDDFAEVIEVFADVVCNPIFPQEELEKYRPRLLDGIRRINENWRSELMACFQSKMFAGSPYRLHRLGSLDVVADATREQVREFFRKHVVGPNTVLAIYGDIDAAEAEALVRRHFASMSSEALPVPDVTAPSVPSSPPLYIKAKPPTRNVAGICLGFPSTTILDAEAITRIAVLDTIISGYRYPTGWLHQSLRGGDRSYVYEVHAFNQPGPIPGAFQMYAACEPAKVNEVYQIITEQLDKAREGKFTAEELDRAKAIIATTELMRHQTNADRAMQSALDELYGLGYDYHEGLTERVAKVSLEDVHATAKRFFTVPTIAVVTSAPDAVSMGIEPREILREPEPGEEHAKVDR